MRRSLDSKDIARNGFMGDCFSAESNYKYTVLCHCYLSAQCKCAYPLSCLLRSPRESWNVQGSPLLTPSPLDSPTDYHFPHEQVRKKSRCCERFRTVMLTLVVSRHFKESCKVVRNATHTRFRFGSYLNWYHTIYLYSDLRIHELSARR